MYNFWYKVIVYLVCFVGALYGLSALDFNRFLKQGRVAQANILYAMLALSIAYLVGTLLLNIVYVMN